MSFLDKIKNKLKGKGKSGSHLEEIKKKRSSQLFEAGVAYYKKGDYKNSKKFFEKSLQYDNENNEARHNLQIVNKQLEQIDEDRRINEEKKNNAVNKTLSQVSVDILKEAASKQEKDDIFYYKALRLDSGSSEEEIRKRINSEFRKWRTRINSPNIKMRSEAEEMLAIISQARRRLLK